MDDLIWAVIVGFILSWLLYSFFARGASASNGFWGEIGSAASTLFLPGMFLSAAVSGSVHVFSLGLAFLINAVIYSVMLFGLLRLRRKIWRVKNQ
jgi:hypothetical protein